jgi:hypothetical protein
MSDIHKLIREYEAEKCDFSNLDWVIKASLRMATYNPIGQADCLLYTLATELKSHMDKVQELEYRLRVLCQNVQTNDSGDPDYIELTSTVGVALFGCPEDIAKLREGKDD